MTWVHMSWCENRTPSYFLVLQVIFVAYTNIFTSFCSTTYFHTIIGSSNSFCSLDFAGIISVFWAQKHRSSDLSKMITIQPAWQSYLRMGWTKLSRFSSFSVYWHRDGKVWWKKKRSIPLPPFVGFYLCTIIHEWFYTKLKKIFFSFAESNPWSFILISITSRSLAHNKCPVWNVYQQTNYKINREHCRRNLMRKRLNYIPQFIIHESVERERDWEEKQLIREERGMRRFSSLLIIFHCFQKEYSILGPPTDNILKEYAEMLLPYHQYECLCVNAIHHILYLRLPPKNLSTLNQIKTGSVQILLKRYIII